MTPLQVYIDVDEQYSYTIVHAMYILIPTQTALSCCLINAGIRHIQAQDISINGITGPQWLGTLCVLRNRCEGYNTHFSPPIPSQKGWSKGARDIPRDSYKGEGVKVPFAFGWIRDTHLSHKGGQETATHYYYVQTYSINQQGTPYYRILSIPGHYESNYRIVLIYTSTCGLSAQQGTYGNIT